MQKISPFLWFDDQAEEAASYYVSLFDDAKITDISRYPEGSPGPAGGVMTVSFTLAGQEFTALNGGPEFTFSEAISFVVALQGPRRGRPSVGAAHGGRRSAGTVRLAHRPVRPELADRSGPADRARGRPRPGSRPAGHAGDAADGEDRDQDLGGRRQRSGSLSDLPPAGRPNVVPPARRLVGSAEWSRWRTPSTRWPIARRSPASCESTAPVRSRSSRRTDWPIAATGSPTRSRRSSRSRAARRA